MAAGLSRPDVWFGYCANRTPNDPNTPSVWTPLESDDFQVWAASGLSRGRDYELAQPLASDPVLFVRDVNEYLNPDNPDSPLAGLVKPYREVAAVCQWPIAPVGAAVNLINTGTWRGSGVDGYDPTFDNYSTGFAAPNWLDRYNVAPTITTTNPQQGTKSVTYTVSAPGQGLAWGVPCIPGRQYTSSVYVRQSAANTVGLFLEGVCAVWDPFNRTVADGTGTPAASWNGAGYTIAPNVPGDYDVVPGALTITLSSANTLKYAVTGSFFNSDQTVLVTAPVLATGELYWEGLVSRYVDVSNQYQACLQFGTDNSVTLVIQRRLAGAETTLSSTVLPFSYQAGDQFYLNFRAESTALYASAWPLGRREAGIYDATVADTSAALQVSGAIGPFAWRGSANTNANLPAEFNSYAASGSVAGDTTTTTGAYVRLDITFTADGLARPAHVDANPLGKAPQGLAVSVVTIGATSASTMNIDAIQHEQGAAASAFSASGPNIFPLFRNFAERYPRTWRAKGYEGATAMPCVDALALLNKISVSNPADQSILNTQPDYFWTLSGGVDTALFPDASGSGGPALGIIVSKYGAGGGPPQAGTDMHIPGAPGDTGVTFIPSGGGTGTVLGVGPSSAGGAPNAIAVPRTPGTPWSATISAIVRFNATTPVASEFVRLVSRAHTMVLRTTPAGVIVFSYNIPIVGPTASVFISQNLNDGQTHYVVGSLSQNATDTTLNIWVDGVAATPVVVSTATYGGIPSIVLDSVQVGAAVSDYVGGFTAVIDGAVSKVAVWRRALTDVEVQAMYLAAAFGLNGETSGARILRHLQDGPYNGPTRIAQATAAAPQTAMGIPSYDGSIDLLTDSLNTMQAEQGMIWVQPDGVIAFEGRQQRWLRSLSNYTFGENGAGNEIAYLDGIIFDHDPTYVFPVVTWTRNGGETALGGLLIDRQAAMDDYFPRRFDGSNDLYDDATAQDIADWIFYTHRSPNTRVQELEIDPWAAQGTAFPVWDKVLRLEPGTRVTAVRRAKAANGGAGLTMSIPCFIERVGMPEISFVEGAERWTVRLQLSPVGSSAAGQPTVQPWILEDATYGVLDSTTVLGW